MPKICIIEKKKIVVLKREIYVEGSKEEVLQWLKQNNFNDESYKWRNTVEYLDNQKESLKVFELPESDDYNFLRFIHKPEIYNLEKDNNRPVSSKPSSI